MPSSSVQKQAASLTAWLAAWLWEMYRSLHLHTHTHTHFNTTTRLGQLQSNILNIMSKPADDCIARVHLKIFDPQKSSVLNTPSIECYKYIGTQSNGTFSQKFRSGALYSNGLRSHCMHSILTHHFVDVLLDQLHSPGLCDHPPGLLRVEPHTLGHNSTW